MASSLDNILDAKEQDFESSSEVFSIDTEGQAAIREVPVIQTQLESASSSVDSQLEINDAINELNIEFKTTSKLVIIWFYNSINF